jgi:hypothetical protein
MMGSEIKSADCRSLRERPQRINVDAVAIDRDWDEGRSNSSKRFPREPIAELLNRNNVART